MFAAEEDDLQVYLGPGGLGEHRLQVTLGPLDGGVVREAPARREAVDVGVHREGRHPEALGHDDAGGLVSDAGEILEGSEISGDLSAVALHEDFRQPADVLRLGGGEAAGLDGVEDVLDLKASHGLRSARLLEEARRDEVDPQVRGLSREEDGDQQGEGVLVIERDRGDRIQLLELEQDPLRLLAALHTGSLTPGRLARFPYRKTCLWPTGRRPSRGWARLRASSGPRALSWGRSPPGTVEGRPRPGCPVQWAGSSRAEEGRGYPAAGPRRAAGIRSPW